ncbi:MAG: serine hydrolase [Defluviitaleaceae bacterium]|nr:serine hydrolase [Defluviitaleaceae bacterium]
MTRIFVKRITAMVLALSLFMGSAVGLLAAEPVRDVFEAAGAVVTWDDDNRIIEIEVMGGEIILEADSRNALVNGEAMELSYPISIKDGVALIEADDLASLSLALMGITVEDTEHNLAITTFRAMAAHLMDVAQVPDFSFAIVDANMGFNYTTTISDETDADTIFHLGSIGKTFTAIAVMQMVEQGLLDLDTPIVEYLPAFSILSNADGQGDYRNITARMLLSHTSGIYPNDMGHGFITYGGHYQDYMNNFLDRFADFYMVTEEGTAFQYANTGFVVLGILVAHLAGHDNYFEGFNQHMLDYVFLPMGLTRTSYVLTSELSAHIAQPYTMVGMPREFQYWNPLPTGTMFSTANEMVSLMTMFLQNGYYNGQQILSPASIDMMFTDQTGEGHYGLGIAFMGDPTGSGYTVVGHNGGMIYNFAAMFLDREHGVGVFSASNSTISQGFNEAIAGAVLATAVTEAGGVFEPISHVDPEAVPVEMSAEEMEALSGLFVTALQHFFVDFIDGQLFLRIPAQGLNVELVPMSDGHFSTEIGIPFWIFGDDEGGVSFVQGVNRYAVSAFRVDESQFIPDDDFMENWYGFTFVAYKARDFYVFIRPSTRFGVTDDGFAYSESEMLTMLPGMTLTILHPMDTGIVLQYEDGVFFYDYMGLRFVRTTF